MLADTTIPCSTCKTYPVLHNSPQGLYIECPKCKKGTKGWADKYGAEWEWEGLNTHVAPAGLVIRNQTKLDRVIERLIQAWRTYA